MELFLNSLWLALAVTAIFALIRKHRADSGQERSGAKRLLVGLGALLCAAALLFPAISITDDLHFDAFAVEDSNSTKRLVNAITHTAPITQLGWLGFIAFAYLLVSRQRSWRRTEIASPAYKSPLFIGRLSGRAPPANLPA